MTDSTTTTTTDAPKMESKLSKLEVHAVSMNRAKYPDGSALAGIEFNCPSVPSTRVRVYFKNPPDAGKPHPDAKYDLVDDGEFKKDNVTIKQPIDLGARHGKWQITKGEVTPFVEPEPKPAVK